MKQSLVTTWLISALLVSCSGEQPETVLPASSVTPAQLSPVQQGQLPGQAIRQNQAADVKQPMINNPQHTPQMQSIQQMETQMRDMLQQVQGTQQNGGQLSRQQLLQMQQQVQQMMQQLQQDAPKPLQQKAVEPDGVNTPDAPDDAKRLEAQPQSSKYTYRGQPLTLEQERKWEALLRRQQMLDQVSANNRALSQASQAVRQAGDRISQQMEYNSLRNACHITDNCRVERYR